MGILSDIKKAVSKPFKKLFRSFRKGSKAIARALGFESAARAVSNLVSPPEIELPSPPTIDEARRDLDEMERIRRRRGALATIFGGAVGGTPTVGTRTLLGGGQ